MEHAQVQPPFIMKRYACEVVMSTSCAATQEQDRTGLGGRPKKNASMTNITGLDFRRIAFCSSDLCARMRSEMPCLCCAMFVRLRARIRVSEHLKFAASHLHFLLTHRRGPAFAPCTIAPPICGNGCGQWQPGSTKGQASVRRKSRADRRTGAPGRRTSDTLRNEASNGFDMSAPRGCGESRVFDARSADLSLSQCTAGNPPPRRGTGRPHPHRQGKPQRFKAQPGALGRASLTKHSGRGQKKEEDAEERAT